MRKDGELAEGHVWLTESPHYTCRPLVKRGQLLVETRFLLASHSGLACKRDGWGQHRMVDFDCAGGGRVVQ